MATLVAWWGKQVFAHFNTALFEGALPKVSVRAMRPLRTRGSLGAFKVARYIPRPIPGRIEIHRDLLRIMTPMAVAQTVVHEMCHLACNVLAAHDSPMAAAPGEADHGPTWRKLMRSCGLEPVMEGGEEEFSDTVIPGGEFELVWNKWKEQLHGHHAV